MSGKLKEDLGSNSFQCIIGLSQKPLQQGLGFEGVWVGPLSSKSNSNSHLLHNSDLIWISSPIIKTKLKFKLRDQKSNLNSNLSSRPGTSSNSNLSSKFDFTAKHMGSCLQHERHMDGNFPLPLGPLEVRLLLPFDIIQRQKSVCISGSSNHEGQSGDSSLCICDCNSQLQQTTGKNFQVGTCSQIWNLESRDRLFLIWRCVSLSQAPFIWTNFIAELLRHQAFAWTQVFSVHWVHCFKATCLKNGCCRYAGSSFK